MEYEVLSLETSKKIASLEKEIEKLNNDATHLLELHKKDKEKINKAIEILDIYGTSNYETADMLYKRIPINILGKIPIFSATNTDDYIYNISFYL